MSSLLTHFPEFTLAHLVHLILIFVVALIVNHLLRVASKLIVKPAATPTRAAQAREQQTRTLSGVLYSTASKVVWVVALLTAAQEIGINVFPVAALAGLATLAISLGAQNFIRDIIAGFHIILEDQFVVGDTIQVAETQGRVEYLSLRRTVVRDSRGALVTFPTAKSAPSPTSAAIGRKPSWMLPSLPTCLRKRRCNFSMPQPPNCATIPRGPRPWWTARACLACSPLIKRPAPCACKCAPRPPATRM